MNTLIDLPHHHLVRVRKALTVELQLPLSVLFNFFLRPFHHLSIERTIHCKCVIDVFEKMVLFPLVFFHLFVDEVLSGLDVYHLDVEAAAGMRVDAYIQVFVREHIHLFDHLPLADF